MVEQTKKDCQVCGSGLIAHDTCSLTKNAFCLNLLRRELLRVMVPTLPGSQWPLATKEVVQDGVTNLKANITAFAKVLVRFFKEQESNNQAEPEETAYNNIRKGIRMFSTKFNKRILQRLRNHFAAVFIGRPWAWSCQKVRATNKRTYDRAKVEE